MNIELIRKALLTLREDAEMALDGTWDKTNKGFEAQLEVIDEALKEFETPNSSSL